MSNDAKVTPKHTDKGEALISLSKSVAELAHEAGRKEGLEEAAKLSLSDYRERYFDEPHAPWGKDRLPGRQEGYDYGICKYRRAIRKAIRALQNTPGEDELPTTTKTAGD